MEKSKNLVLEFVNAFIPYLCGCEHVVFNLREPSSACIEIFADSFKGRLIAELELVAAQNGCSISLGPVTSNDLLPDNISYLRSIPRNSGVKLRIESSTFIPF